MKIRIGTTEIEAQEGLLIDAKWISENAPGIADAFRLEGATAERDRIKGIEEAALPGHETIVSEAKADGKSTGADVALKIVKAENQLRAKKLEDIRDGSAKPVPAAAVAGVPKPEKKDEKTFMALVDEHQTEKKCSRGEAIKAVAASHPEAHEKFLEKQKADAGR